MSDRSAMGENPPTSGPQLDADATDWADWWSWPPRGDVTPMLAAESDDLLATGAPGPAPGLVGLMGRPRRLRRAER